MEALRIAPDSQNVSANQNASPGLRGLQGQVSSYLLSQACLSLFLSSHCMSPTVASVQFLRHANLLLT